MVLLDSFLATFSNYLWLMLNDAQRDRQCLPTVSRFYALIHWAASHMKHSFWKQHSSFDREPGGSNKLQGCRQGSWGEDPLLSGGWEWTLDNLLTIWNEREVTNCPKTHMQVHSKTASAKSPWTEWNILKILVLVWLIQKWFNKEDLHVLFFLKHKKHRSIWWNVPVLCSFKMNAVVLLTPYCTITDSLLLITCKNKFTLT